MSKGSWEQIYVNQGRVQIQVLDSVVEARKIFSERGYKTVLDLGCGTGRHTYYLADYGFKVHACDISRTGLQMTKDLIDQAGIKGVEYSLQNMYQLTFTDEMFEAILCIWVQGHGTIQQIQTGINELYRVLKPGGTVITDFVIRQDATYGIGDEIAPHTFVGGRPGEEDIPHYYTTKNELEIMFNQFEEVKITDKTYKFHDDQENLHEIVAVIVEAIK